MKNTCVFVFLLGQGINSTLWSRPFPLPQFWYHLVLSFISRTWLKSLEAAKKRVDKSVGPEALRGKKKKPAADHHWTHWTTNFWPAARCRERGKEKLQWQNCRDINTNLGWDDTSFLVLVGQESSLKDRKIFSSLRQKRVADWWRQNKWRPSFTSHTHTQKHGFKSTQKFHKATWQYSTLNIDFLLNAPHNANYVTFAS